MVTQTASTLPLQSVGFKKIFVALDYQNADSDVLTQAIDLAKVNNGQLHIYYCQSDAFSGQNHAPIYSGMGSYSGVYSQEMIELEEKLFEESTAQMQGWLEQSIQQAKEQGVIAESSYGFGEAGRQICRVAQGWEADLILLGRRGHKGFSELLMGSVSNYVMHHAHCSVLVVQHS